MKRDMFCEKDEEEEERDVDDYADSNQTNMNSS